MERKEALQELLSTYEKTKQFLPENINHIGDLLANQLLIIELEEKLDHAIPTYTHPLSGYVDLYSNKSLIKFGPDLKSQVPWPDDGEQPAAGWYLRIGFSTGAYSLNSAYPYKSFRSMFDELKSFGVDKCDTANNGLYFSLERHAARQVYGAYQEIYERHYAMAQKEVLSAQIDKAEAELAKLKGAA